MEVDVFDPVWSPLDDDGGVESLLDTLMPTAGEPAAEMEARPAEKRQNDDEPRGSSPKKGRREEKRWIEGERIQDLRDTEESRPFRLL